jgi:hypothetical protein
MADMEDCYIALYMIKVSAISLPRWKSGCRHWQEIDVMVSREGLFLKNLLRTIVFSTLTVFCCIALNGCSGGSGGDAWRYDPGIPTQVSGVNAESGDGVVTLNWTGNPIATSYNVYYVSELNGSRVTKTNGTKITNLQFSSLVVSGLDNNIKYYFMVTALNRDGESVESVQVSATPGPRSTTDLQGIWYFHTLVSGSDAKWERGTVSFDIDGNAVISRFEDSSGNTSIPEGFKMTVQGDGEASQSGSGAWVGFNGYMGVRKGLIAGTFSPTLSSRAITIFQKKRSTDDYSEDDVSGTGSGQNPKNPYLQGNGPTRFAYHLLMSGASTEWEYSNCKIGQHGNIWLDQYKDIIYWDYSTPTYSTAPGYDYLWKVTSIGVDPDGLVKEYSNYDPHNIVFTGRMSADKTLIIGVSTRDDGSGGKKFFLRIMEMNFYPWDRTLPTYSLNDLAGNYNFHKLGALTDSQGNVSPSWAYGQLLITGSGTSSFPSYTDSDSVSSSADTFTLSHFPDPGSDGKFYSDFANFTTPAQSGLSHYYDASGNPLHTYYDYWSYGRTTQPLAIPINPNYYNEHGSLSYNKDLFVMTRTDSAGYSMYIGLK